MLKRNPWCSAGGAVCACQALLLPKEAVSLLYRADGGHVVGFLLFDMTPDEPSTISLSPTSPHLVFAFCTIPFSLPSFSRGKRLCLQHGVWPMLQFLGMALFPPLLSKLMSGGLINKIPLQWSDLPASTDLPLLHLQFLPHSLLLQGCGTPAHWHYQHQSECQRGCTGALGERMSACESVIISMATVYDSTSTVCSSMVSVPVPGARVGCQCALLEGPAWHRHFLLMAGCKGLP